MSHFSIFKGFFSFHFASHQMTGVFYWLKAWTSGEMVFKWRCRGWLRCPLLYGTCWSVANAGFLCFSRKRKVWLLLSPFRKTSEPPETPCIFSQPYIFDNFQEVILGLKTCMPWHVIQAFPVRYNQCYFVETLAVQLRLPASPTRQCCKDVSTK